MRKFSAPPMIIILDVLFVVLFILVLEQSPNMKFVFPKEVWLEDMIVISLDKNKKMQHWYNRTLGKWETLNTFPNNRKYLFFIGNNSCNESQFCTNLPSIPNEVKKIYVKGNLYDELSGMISDSCLTFPKECSNVTYYIQKDGTIDRKRLKRDHQIFRYILNGEGS